MIAANLNCALHWFLPPQGSVFALSNISLLSLALVAALPPLLLCSTFLSFCLWEVIFFSVWSLLVDIYSIASSTLSTNDKIVLYFRLNNIYIISCVFFFCTHTFLISSFPISWWTLCVAGLSCMSRVAKGMSSTYQFCSLLCLPSSGISGSYASSRLEILMNLCLFFSMCWFIFSTIRVPFTLHLSQHLLAFEFSSKQASKERWA